MIYVVNDLHGADNLIKQTLDAMEEMDRGSTLVINGDGAGARGPVMNKIVKLFYEVRRGETEHDVLDEALMEITGRVPIYPDEWVYDTVHAGMFRKLMAERYPDTFGHLMRKEAKEVLKDTLIPLSMKAKEVKCELVYLPGNGEIVPDDFDTTDYTIEKTVAPENRFYQQLYHGGFFDQFDVTYVPYLKVIENNTLLVSTHFLDCEFDEDVLEEQHIDGRSIEKVLVHYPPAIAPMGRAFEFWTPNRSDHMRTGAVSDLMDELDISSDAMMYFGHIHLGPYDERMNRYPSVMGFRTAGFNRCFWIKPGCVVKT